MEAKGAEAPGRRQRVRAPTASGGGGIAGASRRRPPCPRSSGWARPRRLRYPQARGPRNHVRQFTNRSRAPSASRSRLRSETRLIRRPAGRHPRLAWRHLCTGCTQLQELPAPSSCPRLTLTLHLLPRLVGPARELISPAAFLVAQGLGCPNTVRLVMTVDRRVDGGRPASLLLPDGSTTRFVARVAGTSEVDGRLRTAERGLLSRQLR